MELQKSRPLPFWMFFISGISIIIYSQFVIHSYPDSNKPAMTLFTYIGIFLLLIGLIKYIFSWLSKEEKGISNKLSGVDNIDKEEERLANKYNKMYDENNYKPKINRNVDEFKKVQNNNSIFDANINNINSNNINETNKIEHIYCSKCGQRCFKGDAFCSRCGNQLR